MTVDDDSHIVISTENEDSAFQIYLRITPKKIVNIAVYVYGKLVGETTLDPSHSVEYYEEWLRKTLKDFV